MEDFSQFKCINAAVLPNPRFIFSFHPLEPVAELSGVEHVSPVGQVLKAPSVESTSPFQTSTCESFG